MADNYSVVKEDSAVVVDVAVGVKALFTFFQAITGKQSRCIENVHVKVSVGVSWDAYDHPTVNASVVICFVFACDWPSVRTYSVVPLGKV